MKISSLKEELKNAITRVERFTGKNLSLPILSTILFEGTGRRCVLVATNLEMGIREFVSCKVSAEGSVSVPARVLLGAIQRVEGDSVVLEEKNNIISLFSDSANFVINGIAAKDFPILPSIKNGVEETLPSLPFRSAISQVLPAVSVSDIKPELSGVFVSFDGLQVRVAATDSFRLAEKTIFTKDEKRAAFSFILPQKTAQEVVRCFGDEGDIKIVFGDNQVSFELGNVFIISRLIDGAYPDYQQIIPKQFSSYIHIKKTDLVSAVRTAAVVSSRLNDVTISFEEGKVEVLSVNPEVGKTSVTKKAKVNSIGKIGFNYMYLLDGIEKVPGEMVSIGLQNENSAVLIQGTEDQSFLYVLMPIRNM